MRFLNRIFSHRIIKTTMVIIIFLLIVAAIWFLGPFLGFGETRPLESVEARALFIVLAVCCLIGLGFSVPFFLIVATTLGVIVWVIGPYLFIGDGYPLKSVNGRLMVISVIVTITLLYGVWKLLLALKNNPKLLEGFFSHTDETRAEANVSEVNSAIREAADYIKKIRQTLPWFRRLFFPERSADSLPWYMVVGTLEAGKTSAILSSGQHFPLPEQLNRVCKESQPTRSCDCWFANDALFIDTAGKYVEQPQSCLPEWHGILKAIKKYRPVKALNGIIVTLSVAEIMGRNKTELYDLSAKIRARLDDARKALDVRFPVYVLITKVDQLAGFTEYFRSLTEQERGQLWGVTFPYGEEMTTSINELRERVESELTLLENRLERNMTLRQQEEYDNADRKKMYALPQDFRMLAQGVAEVLQNIFFSSRYDETQRYTSLRGVYFVSNHQPENRVMVNNITLMQKWRNFVSNHHLSSQAYSATLQEGSDSLVTDVAWGRQYFLRQLFSDIIIKDADLVQHNLRVESKYRFQNLFGHALCLIAALLLLNGLYHSYKNNGEYQAATVVKVASLENEVKTFQKNPDRDRLPILLNGAQYLPEFAGLEIRHPDIAFRYGLYTGTELAKQADGLYHYFLRRLLLPPIVTQAHESLQSAILNRDSTEIFHALKRYLMLTGQGKFSADYLVSQTTRAWEVSGLIQPYEERSLFVAHLNQLFSDPDWRQYGQPVDKNLIAEAREFLNQTPRNERLYERVKTLLQAQAPENLTLGKMTDEEAGQIFTVIDADLAKNGIPGLFTWEGYHQVFKKKLAGILRGLQDEDRWIMDDSPKSAAGASLKISRTAGVIDPVQDAITGLYLKEYTRQWQDFLRNIRLKSEGFDQRDMGLSFDIYMMRTLVSTQSPLISLAARAVKETTLSAELPDSLLAGQNRPMVSSQLVDAASKIGLALAAHEKKRLREGVDNYFIPLREFVGGISEKGATPSSGTKLAQIMSVLNDQYTLLVISDSAIKSGNLPVVSDTGQRLSAESAVWPDPFKYIIAPLLNGAYRRVNHQIVFSSNKTIAAGLGEICRTTLQGRYPFADNREEVSLLDFERFFAAGGLADDYFKKNLADKVDTSSKPWRYSGDIDTQDSEALDIFERAEEIRSAFFQNGGSKLGINFSVTIPYMDPSITQLNLNFDGSVMTYAHGPVTPKRFQWPGKRAESVVNMSTKPRVTLEDNGMTMTGPWALMRWLDTVKDIATSDSGQPVLIFNLSRRRINVEVTGLTHDDELIIDLLKNFRCPGAF